MMMITSVKVTVELELCEYPNRNTAELRESRVRLPIAEWDDVSIQCTVADTVIQSTCRARLQPAAVGGWFGV